MCLVVSTTNNDPLLVGNLYLNCIKQYNLIKLFQNCEEWMLKLKIYTIKIYRFTSLVKKVFYMLAPQETRGQRPSSQGWKGVNFLGGLIFSQRIFFVWVMAILQKELTEFLMTCSRGKFTAVFWNKDLHELFECYVHIYSLMLFEDPESGIQFYAEVLIFLQNDEKKKKNDRTFDFEDV